MAAIRIFLLAVITELSTALPASADTVCEVRFSQNGAQIHPSQLAGWWLVKLAKLPFQVSVSPVDCRPLIATLPHASLMAEVEQMTKIVFTGVGHGFAGRPEDDDVMHWPSHTPIGVKLREISTAWAVTDSYKAESDRLGYSPQPVQAWGAAFPFKAGLSASVADFRRLTQTLALAPEMPNLQVAGVIYLTVKDLMKPTWFNAVAPYQLVKPYKVIFVFN